MKLLSEKKAIARLCSLREDLVAAVDEYQVKAASCLTCQTPGACCLDAHFVNVHISKLEAVAISNALDEMPPSLQQEVNERIGRTIDEYHLTDSANTHSQKFACPLFQKGVGCLVHTTAKPVACTVHACYEDPADMPPDEIQFEQERRIDRLNELTYGRSEPWLPLPLAIRKLARATHQASNRSLSDP